MSSPVTYLDHAATTTPRPEVLARVAEVAESCWANPSGAHALARTARSVLEQARDQLAAVMGCRPRELVFTSGGTEADDLAVSGVTEAVGRPPACGATEHPAVAAVVRRWGGVMIPVDRRGLIDPHDVASAAAGGGLVSIMAVNNETGVVNEVVELAAAARSAGAAAVHVDAVQLDPAALPRLVEAVDLVTVTGHKHGGPKGVGALFVREGTPLVARLPGGGQERERRGGTPDVAGAAGVALALELAAADEQDYPRRRRLAERLREGLISAGWEATVDASVTAAGFCHVLAPRGVLSEDLLLLAERQGIMASAGSSCSSGAVAVSKVLSAMGVDADRARSAVRLTMGWSSTEDDVERALAVLVPVAEGLTP